MNRRRVVRCQFDGPGFPSKWKTCEKVRVTWLEELVIRVTELWGRFRRHAR